jgi:hypothetical protein
MRTQPGYDLYPTTCRFPGCRQPAPRAAEADTPLCIEHERLRFYHPDEFTLGWQNATTAGGLNAPDHTA